MIEIKTEIELPEPPFELPPITNIRGKLMADLGRVIYKNGFKKVFFFEAFSDKVLKGEPIIILRDENDEIAADGYEYLSHTLKVTIKLITASYKESFDYIQPLLIALKEYRSEFVVKQLNDIDRDDLENLDNRAYCVSFDLTLIYKSDLWCF